MLCAGDAGPVDKARLIRDSSPSSGAGTESPTGFAGAGECAAAPQGLRCAGRERIPAWHAAEAARLVKTPKMHAVDTGLMCAVRGINRRRLLGNPADLGALLESFVYNELRKQ